MQTDLEAIGTPLRSPLTPATVPVPSRARRRARGRRNALTAAIDDAVALIDLALSLGRPEMVFGEDPSREYRRLVRRLHPDVNSGSDEATVAFRKLDDLWRLAVTFRDAGTYGRERSPLVTVTTKQRSYQLLDRVGRDDVADRFLCRWNGAHGVARVPRKPRDNDLMKAEANVLRLLRDPKRFEQSYQPFLPDLIESAAVKQTGGIVRQTNIFQLPAGNWYSLADVIDRYPNGIDPRDMAWMWRRLLMILGAVHRGDAIHGAVLPENVLIEPSLHGLILANWSFSVPRGGIVPAVSRDWRGYYAPEVLAKKPAGRGSDFYLAARTMVAISNPRALGAATVPPSWPRTFRAFFRACFLDVDRRPRDAWRLLEDFDAVLERTYGPRQFRPFTMKEGATA